VLIGVPIDSLHPHLAKETVMRIRLNGEHPMTVLDALRDIAHAVSAHGT
jgi:hypothetical protein